LGPAGRSCQNSLATLQAYALTIKDIKPLCVLGVGAGVDALKDGKMDAVITTIPADQSTQSYP